jgi:hypothetical protein
MFPNDKESLSTVHACDANDAIQSLGKRIGTRRLAKMKLNHDKIAKSSK